MISRWRSDFWSSVKVASHFSLLNDGVGSDKVPAEVEEPGFWIEEDAAVFGGAEKTGIVSDEIREGNRYELLDAYRM